MDKYIIEDEGVGTVTLTSIISGVDGETYYELEVMPLSKAPEAFFVVLTRQTLDLVRGTMQVMLDKTPERSN